MGESINFKQALLVTGKERPVIFHQFSPVTGKEVHFSSLTPGFPGVKGKESIEVLHQIFLAVSKISPLIIQQVSLMTVRRVEKLFTRIFLATSKENPVFLRQVFFLKQTRIIK